MGKRLSRQIRIGGEIWAQTMHFTKDLTRRTTRRQVRSRFVETCTSGFKSAQKETSSCPAACARSMAMPDASSQGIRCTQASSPAQCHT
eukprot:scaffold259025_cov34-Tisochrysis_lutea.AAC.5